jgi:hypothetical protein
MNHHLITKTCYKYSGMIHQNPDVFKVFSWRISFQQEFQPIVEATNVTRKDDHTIEMLPNLIPCVFCNINLSVSAAHICLQPRPKLVNFESPVHTIQIPKGNVLSIICQILVEPHFCTQEPQSQRGGGGGRRFEFKPGVIMVAGLAWIFNF